MLFWYRETNTLLRIFFFKIICYFVSLQQRDFEKLFPTKKTLAVGHQIQRHQLDFTLKFHPLSSYWTFFFIFIFLFRFFNSSLSNYLLIHSFSLLSLSLDQTATTRPRQKSSTAATPHLLPLSSFVCLTTCFQFQVIKFWYELLWLRQISIIFLGFRFLANFAPNVLFSSSYTVSKLSYHCKFGSIQK
jgi:hypothetical protein